MLRFSVGQILMQLTKKIEQSGILPVFAKHLEPMWFAFRVRCLLLIMKASYNELIEDIIDYQACLSKAFLNYNYEEIELYSRKIARLIKKILDDNKMTINK